MCAMSHGLIPQTHVSNVVEHVLSLCDQDLVTVIRSIDSAYSLIDLTKILDFHGVPYSVMNGNVCVSTDNLRKAVSKDVFTGFDEVWILRGGPPDLDLSDLPPLTSDGTDLSVEIPTELVEAIARTNCVLAIGDGCGLNFATMDERLAQEIRDAEQAE